MSMINISPANGFHFDVPMNEFKFPENVDTIEAFPIAVIHLERGFASMPRPPVKRHTIFCHACPSPALLSTACAVVINKKLNNKTEKTRGLPCLAPISAPSVLLRISYESFVLKYGDFSRFLLCGTT